MERLLSAKLQNKIQSLPQNPGVYLMKDETGQVIYVGKARVLKNRVRQYFTSEANHLKKVANMVAKIHDFDYILTDTEIEALVLEANLVKKYSPYYNIMLKDDKRYPYVRIDLKEDFPRVEIVRRVKMDDAKYFGPFLAAHSIEEALDAIYKLFPLRTCKRDLSGKYHNARACLNYQMGRCTGPCIGKVSKEAYGEYVKQVMDFLSGKHEKLLKQMEREMQAASDALEFEKAAVLRDKYKALLRIVERNHTEFPDLNDRDVFAAAIGEETAVIQAFFVRKGKLQETNRFYTTPGETEAQVLESFLKQYYIDQTTVPNRVLIGAEIEDQPLIAAWLGQIRGSKVELITPKRGDNKKLVDMARLNAVQALARREENAKREYEKTVGAVKKLGDVLGIPYPRRMECYDISNTQGTDSVASMVVFVDGKPAKKEYRRFRIKTVEGANDFASMEEVLERRLLEGFKVGSADTGFGAMPDLIVVDGGKGQLAKAVSVLEGMGLEEVAVIGLAKREEEVFLPHQSDPIVLSKKSAELKLLMAIRDEAHRFAITYHRALREKRTLSSDLDKIPGVGKKRKLLLLEAFSDIEGIRNADIDDLSRIKGIDIATARAVYQFFRE